MFVFESDRERKKKVECNSTGFGAKKQKSKYSHLLKLEEDSKM